MHRIKLALLAALVAAAIPTPASAHRTWMLPSASHVDGRDPWVTVDVAVSENLFDFDANPVMLDGLRITGPDGQALEAQQSFTGKLRSVFDVKLDKPGTYRLAITTESAMASYTLNGTSKRWRGSVEAMKDEIPTDAQGVQATRIHTRLETYVTAGESSHTAIEPAGQGLEVIPLEHPTEYLAGQTGRFRVLLDGKPLPGLKLAVTPGGVRYRGVLNDIAATTDAKGEFSVTWPMAQMYWINASYPPRAPAPAEGQPRPAPPTQRYSYSGTFEVLPE